MTPYTSGVKTFSAKGQKYYCKVLGGRQGS